MAEAKYTCKLLLLGCAEHSSSSGAVARCSTEVHLHCKPVLRPHQQAQQHKCEAQNTTKFWHYQMSAHQIVIELITDNACISSSCIFVHEHLCARAIALNVNYLPFDLKQERLLRFVYAVPDAEVLARLSLRTTYRSLTHTICYQGA